MVSKVPVLLASADTATIVTGLEAKYGASISDPNGLGAGDHDARQRAKAALLEAAASPPPTVTFPGLDSFGDRVLFAKVEDASGDGRLAAVAAASKRALEAHGFLNQPDFAPHMTLAKTSKARTRRRLKIPKASWAALADAPETINESPYEDGWLLRLTPDDAAAAESLLDAAAYAAHIDDA